MNRFRLPKPLYLSIKEGKPSRICIAISTTDGYLHQTETVVSSFDEIDNEIERLIIEFNLKPSEYRVSVGY